MQSPFITIASIPLLSVIDQTLIARSSGTSNGVILIFEHAQTRLVCMAHNMELDVWVYIKPGFQIGSKQKRKSV